MTRQLRAAPDFSNSERLKNNGSSLYFAAMFVKYSTFSFSIENSSSFLFKSHALLELNNNLLHLTRFVAPGEPGFLEPV